MCCLRIIIPRCVSVEMFSKDRIQCSADVVPNFFLHFKQQVFPLFCSVNFYLK